MPDAQSVSALQIPIRGRGKAARGGVHALQSRSAWATVSGADAQGAKPAANDSYAARSNGPTREALVNLVRSYVLAHIHRAIAISEIVAITGVNESTLRRAVAAQGGTPLVQFITDVRLDQANALLSTNRESRSVTQIAAVLGFVSATTFSRSYRRRFAESATETRRRAVRCAELPTEATNKNS